MVRASPSNGEIISDALPSVVLLTEEGDEGEPSPYQNFRHSPNRDLAFRAATFSLSSGERAGVRASSH